jgi:Zn ribbon nucleic-acid-binding protein
MAADSPDEAEGWRDVTEAEEACPSCGEGDGICYTAEEGLFRIYCSLCGHTTKRHAEFDEARLDWWLSRKPQVD